MVGAKMVGVVGATVVGAAVASAAAVDAAMVGASVIDSPVVNAAMVEAAMVGAAMVDTAMNGAAVVGATLGDAAKKVPTMAYVSQASAAEAGTDLMDQVANMVVVEFVVGMDVVTHAEEMVETKITDGADVMVLLVAVMG